VQLPLLPVDGTFRHIPHGAQFEGAVTNLSDEPLEVTALIVSHASGQTARLEFDIPAGMPQHIGIDDGVDLQPGDEITLHNPGYSDRVIVIR
jgi:hypothetical protein